MSRLKSAVTRLEVRFLKVPDPRRDCSCEWAVEERRAAEIGPEGRAQELRNKVIEATEEWNDPEHPRHLRQEEFRAQSLAEYEERKASLKYWGQPNSELGVCEACPLPDSKRSRLALAIKFDEFAFPPDDERI